MSITTLTMVDGPVLLRHGDEDFSPASKGDVIAAGDTIRAGTGASAEITYFEGSSVRVEPETELVVQSLRTETSRGAVTGVVQAVERTWHVVTNLASGNSRYDVRGPSPTASVRG